MPPARDPSDDAVGIGEVSRNLESLRQLVERGFSDVRADFASQEAKFVTRELYDSEKTNDRARITHLETVISRLSWWFGGTVGAMIAAGLGTAIGLKH